MDDDPKWKVHGFDGVLAPLESTWKYHIAIHNKGFFFGGLRAFQTLETGLYQA